MSTKAYTILISFIVMVLIFTSLSEKAFCQTFDLQLCSSVNTSTYEPLETKDSFNVNEKFITSFITIKDISGGTKIRFQWIDPDGNIYREAMGDVLTLPPGKIYPEFKAWNSIILRTNRAAWFPGTWTVKVFLNDKEIASRNFTIEQTEQLPSEYPPPYKTISQVRTQSDIAGIITDIHTGLPVEGAELEIGNLKTVTDKNGYYHLCSVPEGKGVLKIKGPEYYPAIYDITVKNTYLYYINIPCVKYYSEKPVTAEIQTEETLYSGIYHLYPLLNKFILTYIVTNVSDTEQKVLLTGEIEGYSAEWADTIIIPPGTTYILKQNPPFLPEKIKKLTELQTGLLKTSVINLDGEREILIKEESNPITLLARDTYVYFEKNPVTGSPDFLNHTIGAWLTTHIPEIDKMLKTAAANHPENKLVGYQAKEFLDIETNAVIPREQASAIYNTLKDLGLIYTNASTQFGTDEMTTKAQRAKLPEDVIESQSANCIEGALLVTTLLEAAHLNPVIVIMSSGHAFVGWEKWDKAGEYDFINTTYIGRADMTFEDALERGNSDYEKAIPLIQSGKAIFLDILTLRENGITPMK